MRLVFLTVIVTLFLSYNVTFGTPTQPLSESNKDQSPSFWSRHCEAIKTVGAVAAIWATRRVCEYLSHHNNPDISSWKPIIDSVPPILTSLLAYSALKRRFKSLSPSLILEIHNLKHAKEPIDIYQHFTFLRAKLEKSNNPLYMEAVIAENVYEYFALTRPKEEVMRVLSKKSPLTNIERAIYHIHSGNDCGHFMMHNGVIHVTIRSDTCVELLVELNDLNVFDIFSTWSASITISSLESLTISPLKSIRNMPRLRLLGLECGYTALSFDSETIQQISESTRKSITQIEVINGHFKSLEGISLFPNLNALLLNAISTDNQLSLESLSGLKNLKNLVLNQFSNAVHWQAVAQISSLETLNIMYSDISDLHWLDGHQLNQLTKLILKGNRISTLQNYPTLDTVVELDLSNNPVDILSIPQSLCRHLNVFKMTRSAILGTASESIRYLRNHCENPNLQVIFITAEGLVDIPKLSLDRQQLYQTAKEGLLRLENYQFFTVKVSYKNEMGDDLGGLSSDFVTQISTEMAKEEHGIFTSEKDEYGNVEYYFSPHDSSKESDYAFVGKVLAFAYVKKIPLSIVLKPIFFKLILEPTVELSLDDLNAYDHRLYLTMKSLLKKETESISEYQSRLLACELTFADPFDNPLDYSIDKNTTVTADNLDEYMRLFVNQVAKVRYQETIEIISDSFNQVMAANPHLEHISKLTKETLQNTLTPSFIPNIDLWIQKLRATGFSNNDRIKALFSQLLSEWNESEQERLKLHNVYRLVTGQNFPNKDMPPFVLSHKQKDTSHPHNNYPMARTCNNQVDIIEYETLKDMKDGFEAAINNFLNSNGRMLVV